MKPVDVMVAGELFQDLILSGFDRWPGPGYEVFAQDFAREAGGGAAITAAGLAKLGMKTQVFGFVGASDSEWLLGRLGGTGLDTSAIRLHESEPTAFTVVASTAEDRAFLTYAGANRSFPAALRESAEAGAFDRARHVHLACALELAHGVKLLDTLHAAGCSVSLDVGWHPEWLDDPRAVEVLRQVDVFFPNEVESLRLTRGADSEEALARFSELGLKRVALKLGVKGAVLLWDGSVFRGHPVRVEAVDVTGAGDCFDAGFLFAWLRGFSPQQCLDAGNLCGALSTEARGGIAGFPTREKVMELW